MEFLNTTGLYALFLLPLLLIPYLIRRRSRRLVFSSLLFFSASSARSRARPWGRLKLPPIFFLQLLLLMLLLLTLGEPAVSHRPLRIALVIDNSASMQALQGQWSRFEMARESARELLEGFSASSRIDLFHIAPRIEMIGEAMAPREAGALLGKVNPYDVGEATENYGEELKRLVEERKYERLFFVTDHPARGQSRAVRVITIGAPTGNLAITSFEISRSSLASSHLEAKIEVTNFSSDNARPELLLRSGAEVLSSRTIAVASRKSASTSFESIPLRTTYEAEIQIRDAMDLDNRRVALPPPSSGLKLLGVSPRPAALQSLRAISGLEVEIISPPAYGKGLSAGRDLEIFHYAAPTVLPESHALFILPPEVNPLVTLGKPLSRPVISEWREAHPLTRYVNFDLFRPNYARSLRALSFGEPILQSPEGPLAVALEHKGFRYLVLGFDPLPYLGRENLPVSIFTLNFLEWFYKDSGSSGEGTGAPIDLGDPREAIVLVTPKGERVPIARGDRIFSQTFYQGLYQIIRGKGRELVALNLQDVRESDLARLEPIDLRGVSSPKTLSLIFPLWPYFILFALLLLALEWFLNPQADQK